MTDTTTPTQRFHVSHLNEADFEAGGLRPYSAYRDLGVAKATSGLATAQVIRMTAPFQPAWGLPHRHAVQFQMVYVLKGWFETEMDGQGPQRMAAGSCWTQPPGIAHRVLGWSDDCELLEVVLPADFSTSDAPLPAPPPPLD